ncbi:MAG: histone deacetylase, partial [Proteobacteria bacterium]|nr:histone deacetylase [Pseudomonadota bacterium]
MHHLVKLFPFNQTFFQVYSHPDCLNHETGLGNPEIAARLQSIYTGCKSIPESTEVSFSIPQPATREQLELVHDRSYLMALESSCMKMKPYFMSPDNQICLDTYTAVLAAGGSALALSDTLFDGGSGFALIRPPGHHAGRNVAEGFCFINHIPLAIENIRKQQADARFLVVDFDVHHGNGIDYIYNNCDKIYYFSIHGSPEHIYPNTGTSNETGNG